MTKKIRLSKTIFLLIIQIFAFENLFSQYADYENALNICYTKKEIKKIEKQNIYQQDSILYQFAEVEKYNTNEFKSQYYFCLAVFSETINKNSVEANIYYNLCLKYLNFNKILINQGITKEFLTQKITKPIEDSTYLFVETFWKQVYKTNLTNQFEIFLLTHKHFNKESYNLISQKIDSKNYPLTNVFLIYTLFDDTNPKKTKENVSNIMKSNEIEKDKILYQFYTKEVLNFMFATNNLQKNEDNSKKESTKNNKILVSERDIIEQIIKVNAYKTIINLNLNDLEHYQTDSFIVQKINVYQTGDLAQNLNINFKFLIKDSLHYLNETTLKSVEYVTNEILKYYNQTNEVVANINYTINYYNCANLKIKYAGDFGKIIINQNYNLNTFNDTIKNQGGTIIPIAKKDVELCAEDFAFMTLYSLNYNFTENLNKITIPINPIYNVNLHYNKRLTSYYELEINYEIKNLFATEANKLKLYYENYKN